MVFFCVSPHKPPDNFHEFLNAKVHVPPKVNHVLTPGLVSDSTVASSNENI